MKQWEDFNRFTVVDDKYLPQEGQGTSKAQQVCTAVSKIVYRWFNDGDVYDNTSGLRGWGNDLSPYANWLFEHTGAGDMLLRVHECYTDEDYTQLLFELCEEFMNFEYLDAVADKPAEGSIYKCDGPFVFEEEEEEW